MIWWTRYLQRVFYLSQWTISGNLFITNRDHVAFKTNTILKHTLLLSTYMITCVCQVLTTWTNIHNNNTRRVINKTAHFSLLSTCSTNSAILLRQNNNSTTFYKFLLSKTLPHLLLYGSMHWKVQLEKLQNRWKLVLTTDSGFCRRHDYPLFYLQIKTFANTF